MIKIKSIICYFLMYMPVLCHAYEEDQFIKATSSVCIRPVIEYQYATCNDINFMIDNNLFTVPANFHTDLASIPKVIWPFYAPYHASIIRPAIIHDWFYSNQCQYTRGEKDIIFYNMLREEGVSSFKSHLMYYAVRAFGWSHYKDIDCGV